MGETGTEESEGWTKANLQQLLAAMKANIPSHARNDTYTKGLKTMDWNVVAFPPFSPEACKEKWKQILQQMSKTRTLTELLVEAEGVVSNSVNNVKIHPECPKRPAHPNAIFFEENVSNYQKEHPKMSQQKIFTNLVTKYEMLPDKEKAQYEDKFQLATEEYTRKMQLFSKQYLKPTCPKRKTKLKKLSANTKPQVTEDTQGLPPKPPANGYILFCKRQRTSGEGFDGNNHFNVWGQSWRDMSEKQRDTYRTRSTMLKRQYVDELNQYLMNFDEEKQQQILKEHSIKRPKVSTRIKKNHQKKLPGEPKMPSRSGCDIFRKKQMFLLREEIPNSRERFVMVSKLWLELPAVEKKLYKKELLNHNKKYSLELRKWFKTMPEAEQKLYRKHNPSKIKYLDDDQMDDYDSEEPCGSVYRPSDSEDDDDTDNSDDDEEESNLESDEEEEEEEEEDHVIVFEMY